MGLCRGPPRPREWVRGQGNPPSDSAPAARSRLSPVRMISLQEPFDPFLLFPVLFPIPKGTGRRKCGIPLVPSPAQEHQPAKIDSSSLPQAHPGRAPPARGREGLAAGFGKRGSVIRSGVQPPRPREAVRGEENHPPPSPPRLCLIPSPASLSLPSLLPRPAVVRDSARASRSGVKHKIPDCQSLLSPGAASGWPCEAAALPMGEARRPAPGPAPPARGGKCCVAAGRDLVLAIPMPLP